MKRLTKYEQETIIRYNQEEEIAYMDVMHPALIRHLENKLGLKPITTDAYGGKTFELPKDWLRFPQKPRKLSNATKDKLSRRMRNLAKKKNRQ